MTLRMVLPLEFQFEFWGAAWAGDTTEITATLCEQRCHDHPDDYPMWDYDGIKYLWTQLKTSPVAQIIYWWSLPWVAEDQILQRIR